MGKVLDVKSDDKCKNCFADFADHNWDESRNVWVCPHPHQEDGYGYFKGGDPRKFCPDYESNTPSEINAWRAACRKCDEAEDRGEPLEAFRGGFGVGIYTIESEQTWEAI